MVSLIGAVCGLALIYVIPVSVHIKSKHMQIQNDENWNRFYLDSFLHICIVCVGVYVMLVNIV